MALLTISRSRPALDRLHLISGALESGGLNVTVESADQRAPPVTTRMFIHSSQQPQSATVGPGPGQVLFQPSRCWPALLWLIIPEQS